MTEVKSLSALIKYALYLVILLSLSLAIANEVPFDRLFHRGTPSSVAVSGQMPLDRLESLFYNKSIETS